jgi:Fe-S-cluster containining protein
MLDPKSFKCERCAECCKKLYIILNDEDIKNIEKLGYSKEDFCEGELIGEFKGKFVLKKEDDKCIFLEKDKDGYSCSIYESRPEICRKYPFFGKEVETCKP